MQFGRTYEEFEVGAVYKHWPGKTVTEYDDHLFCLLTMNHHPLHTDSHYAEETTQFGKNVVVGNYVYSLLLGMSVPDVSGKAIANLEVESLRHVAPTFHGDTVYGETTVLDGVDRGSHLADVVEGVENPENVDAGGGGLLDEHLGHCLRVRRISDGVPAAARDETITPVKRTRPPPALVAGGRSGLHRAA